MLRVATSISLIFEKVDADAIAKHDEEKESEEAEVSDVSDDIGEKGKGPSALKHLPLMISFWLQALYYL